MRHQQRSVKRGSALCRAMLHKLLLDRAWLMRSIFTQWLWCRPGCGGNRLAGTVTLSLNGRCRTADQDQKVMRKGLHLSRCSKRSTLRLVHDAFHLQTVDPATMKQVGDRIVDGEKSLNVPRCFEAFHDALASSGRYRRHRFQSPADSMRLALRSTSRASPALLPLLLSERNPSTKTLLPLVAISSR